MPTTAWSRRVYPDLPDAEGLSKLCDAVSHACRLDTESPVLEWKRDTARLAGIAAWLGERSFDRFELRGPGTELVLDMPPSQRWIGDVARTPGGTEFIPNMPTQEVFSAPDWRTAEGRVRSTRPMILGGANVGLAEFELDGGRIVHSRCEGEQKILDQELDLDDRSRYLGEIALVSEDSRIAELKTTFYDGLYDENAGCHLAFGNSYAGCVDGGGGMTDDEKLEAGLNVSKQHVDFTVGSDELTVTAVDAEGGSVDIIEAGRWTSQVLSGSGAGSKQLRK